MFNVEILVRTDLRTSSGKKVPNGKMASQSAHALMIGFLSMFDKKNKSLNLRPKNQKLLEAFINKTVNVKLIPIKTENELLKRYNENKENSFIVKDQGRTSFDTPTITTMVIMPEGFEYLINTNCDSEYSSAYKSKQVFVINKDHIKDKWEMFNLVSNASIQPLLKMLSESSNNSISLENEGFRNWIEGAFAKITLKPSQLSFNNILEKSKEADIVSCVYIDNNIEKVISFGPDFVNKVDAYTKEGLSLA